MSRECGDKVKFASKGLARICIIDNQLHNHQPYFCQLCIGWHIGKRNPISEWKRKERKEKW